MKKVKTLDAMLIFENEQKMEKLFRKPAKVKKDFKELSPAEKARYERIAKNNREAINEAKKIIKLNLSKNGINI